MGEGRTAGDAARRCLPGQEFRRHRVAHQSRGDDRDAHVCLRSARAECRGAVEAGHVRPRAARDLSGRTGDDHPVRRHAVPLRRLPGVRRRGRPTGGARAQDRRPRRRPHGDPRRIEHGGSRGGDGRRYADRRDEDRGRRENSHAVRALRPPAGVRDDARDVARRARPVLVPRPRRRSLPEGRSRPGQRVSCGCRARRQTR